MLQIKFGVHIDTYNSHIRAEIALLDLKDKCINFLILDYPEELLQTKIEDYQCPAKPTLVDVSGSTPKVLEILDKSIEPLFGDIVAKAISALEMQEPELCEEGVNGTYFLKDKAQNVLAVFKPEDEEMNSPNSPKKNEDEREILYGLQIGEAARKEVAAFLLDSEGFYDVPPTAMVRVKEKRGSFQKFVDNDGASWDIGSRTFPVKEVHKIGILDLHILNLDRHGGNILYKELDDGTVKLIPIDHGFSMPDTLSGNKIWFEWMTWSQSKEPFDTETKAYIERINPDRDIRMLAERLHIRPACLKTMRMSIELLKRGARNELTLYDIGSMICQMQPDQPSLLEILVDKTKSSEGDESHLATLFALLDTEIEKKKTSKFQTFGFPRRPSAVPGSEAE